MTTLVADNTVLILRVIFKESELFALRTGKTFEPGTDVGCLVVAVAGVCTATLTPVETDFFRMSVGVLLRADSGVRVVPVDVGVVAQREEEEEEEEGVDVHPVDDPVPFSESVAVAVTSTVPSALSSSSL